MPKSGSVCSTCRNSVKPAPSRLYMTPGFGYARRASCSTARHVGLGTDRARLRAVADDRGPRRRARSGPGRPPRTARPGRAPRSRHTPWARVGMSHPWSTRETGRSANTTDAATLVTSGQRSSGRSADQARWVSGGARGRSGRSSRRVVHADIRQARCQACRHRRGRRPGGRGQRRREPEGLNRDGARTD